MIERSMRDDAADMTDTLGAGGQLNAGNVLQSANTEAINMKRNVFGGVAFSLVAARIAAGVFAPAAALSTTGCGGDACQSATDALVVAEALWSSIYPVLPTTVQPQAQLDYDYALGVAEALQTEVCDIQKGLTSGDETQEVKDFAEALSCLICVIESFAGTATTACTCAPDLPVTPSSIAGFSGVKPAVVVNGSASSFQAALNQLIAQQAQLANGG
jgi:hypothetical protein